MRHVRSFAASYHDAIIPNLCNSSISSGRIYSFVTFDFHFVKGKKIVIPSFILKYSKISDSNSVISGSDYIIAVADFVIAAIDYRIFRVSVPNFGGRNRAYQKKSLHLPPNRFCISRSGIWIKRESGVNPGQSRCCEAPF